MGLDKKTRTSDLLLEELAAEDYDFVIVERHAMTKVQEFMFGDVAARLIREAGVPVVTVKTKTKGDDS